MLSICPVEVEEVPGDQTRRERGERIVQLPIDDGEIGIASEYVYLL